MAVRNQILNACANKLSVRDVCKLNFDVGNEFARAIQQQIKKSDKKIDLIGSHGQTSKGEIVKKIIRVGWMVVFLVWHEVLENDKGIFTHSTLQIGEGSIIAAETNTTTISDFRVIFQKFTFRCSHNQQ